MDTLLDVDDLGHCTLFNVSLNWSVSITTHNEGLFILFTLFHLCYVWIFIDKLLDVDDLGHGTMEHFL